tara:strand:- start:27 stop:413 length:387 start_codon:yes stop_codon:yes gene_type:complete
MFILGIGVDIVNNDRIKQSIKNKRFVKKIYTNKEINLSKKIKNKVNFFSKRFAAKEAFLKSIGTGLSNGLSFKDIEVMNNKLGAPSLAVSSKIKKIIKEKYKTNKYQIFLSISDEKNYSIAQVILNKV